MLKLSTLFETVTFSPDFPKLWTRCRTTEIARLKNNITLRASPINDSDHKIFVDDLGKYIKRDKTDYKKLQTNIIILHDEEPRVHTINVHTESYRPGEPGASEVELFRYRLDKIPGIEKVIWLEEWDYTRSCFTPWHKRM